MQSQDSPCNRTSTHRPQTSLMIGSTKSVCSNQCAQTCARTSARARCRGRTAMVGRTNQPRCLLQIRTFRHSVDELSSRHLHCSQFALWVPVSDARCKGKSTTMMNSTRGTSISRGSATAAPTGWAEVSSSQEHLPSDSSQQAQTLASDSA